MRVLLLVLSLLGATAAAAQPVAVPGTRASLDPPEGYVAAETFPGFQHDDLSASLMVVEVPGAPLAELFEAFTPEALANQGVLAARVDTVEVGGQMAALVTGWQRAYGESFDKWILVTGDSAGVVMVNAALPREAASGAADALVTALYTLTIGDASADLFDGMPFRLKVPKELGDRQKAAGGLFFAEASGTDAPPGSPLYIIGTGIAPLLRDLAAAPRRRIRETVTVTDIRDIETRPLAVDGREGVEAVATAKDDTTGEELALLLVMVPRGNGYVISQAMVGADRAEAWLPRFRAITESIVWTE
ncbi:MAG: hypothetical protein AAFQ43_04805 [Bacteroidota bacterium]